jgi:DNA-binding NtrC family response regulator
MVDGNSVLSFDPDRKTLLNYELALRDGGYSVISVYSAIQARYEIEMGRCGILLLSFIVPPVICLDLVSAFRRYCPPGIVVFVTNDLQTGLTTADVICLEGDDPHAIVPRIMALRSKAS